MSSTDLDLCEKSDFDAWLVALVEGKSRKHFASKRSCGVMELRSLRSCRS